MEPEKKIRRNRPTKYPTHLTVMVTEEQKAKVEAKAAAAGISKGDVVRRLIDLLLTTQD